MRRLLPAVIALALLPGLAMAAQSSARAPRTSGRVPGGVTRVSVTLTFPPHAGGTRRALHRTLTGARAVRAVVGGLDSLRPARVRGMCPQYLRLAPALSVVLRSGTGSVHPALAEAQVAVSLGTHGASGSSACFPIHFSSRGHSEALIGNGFVRLIGRLVGTSIS